MKTICFCRRDDSLFTKKIALECYEDTGDGYKEIDDIKLYMAKEIPGYVYFEYKNYTRDSCWYHSAKSLRELVNERKRWGLIQIDQKNYNRYRKAVLAMYSKAINNQSSIV